MLDRFIKFTTILGTFLIFNGVVYLSIYYQNFDIKIFSYLEFTEVLTSFIDSLKTILTFFGIYLAHLFLTIVLTFKAIEKLENSRPNGQAASADNNEEHLKGFMSSVNIGLVIQLIIAIVFAILILTGCWQINQYLIYYFSFVGFNIVHALGHSVEKIFTAIFGEKPYEVFFAVLVFILPFTVYTIVFAEFNAITAKQNPERITLFGKDNSVSNAQFIGKTNNYIFLYDTTTKKSTSLSLDDIKAIEYQ